MPARRATDETKWEDHIKSAVGNAAKTVIVRTPLAIPPVDAGTVTGGLIGGYSAYNLTGRNPCGTTVMPCASSALGLPVRPQLGLTGQGHTGPLDHLSITYGMPEASGDGEKEAPPLQLPRVTALPEDLQNASIAPDGRDENGQAYWNLTTVEAARQQLRAGGAEAQSAEISPKDAAAGLIKGLPDSPELRRLPPEVRAEALKAVIASAGAIEGIARGYGAEKAKAVLSEALGGIAPDTPAGRAAELAGKELKTAVLKQHFRWLLNKVEQDMPDLNDPKVMEFMTKYTSFLGPDGLPTDGVGDVAAAVFSYPYYEGVKLPSKTFIPSPPTTLESGPQWYIHSLGRNAAYKGGGFGVRLLDRAFYKAREAGYGTVTLEAYDDNAAARSLYLRELFKDISAWKDGAAGRKFYFMRRELEKK